MAFAQQKVLRQLFVLVHPDFVQRTGVVSIPGVLDQRGAPTCQRSFDPVRSERVHPEAWM